MSHGTDRDREESLCVHSGSQVLIIQNLKLLQADGYVAHLSVNVLHGLVFGS